MTLKTHVKKPTILVMGDQLNRNISSLIGQSPSTVRILMVEIEKKFDSNQWHIQKAHLILSAMRHFADELRQEGFEVDYRVSKDLVTGITEHSKEFMPEEMVVMEPMNWNGQKIAEKCGLKIIRNNQFLCHYEDFAGWVGSRKSFKMEDFYRWQRKRLQVLMDGDSPIGGKWNFDHENRERPPRDGRKWPEIKLFTHDQIDKEILNSLSNTWGAVPKGVWPVTREQALIRLDEFIHGALPIFGPYEDAMLSQEWKLAHSVLSSSLNIGLLHPSELVAAAEFSYHDGNAPMNSVEGFIRQIIGWREYVWGLYWLWMPEYRNSNYLEANREVPPAFLEKDATEMACISGAMDHLYEYAYTHHIERLMVFGNLSLTSGLNPQGVTNWMWSRFIDGAEWVMLPNVLGMAVHADGGKMATKPYASGGAYINRMSNYCSDCIYDPKKRSGELACPFTTLYWDFLARNENKLSNNPRMGQQYAGLRRLSNLDEVRNRASEVLFHLDDGTL